MNSEELRKALNDLNSALAHLRTVGSTATAVESLLVLDLLERTAIAKQKTEALLDAVTATEG